MLYDIVVGERFVQGCHHFHSLIQQVDQVWEGVPEEATDPHGNVDAGPAQLLKRDDLQSLHATALGLPSGPDSEQVQDLGDVVAVGPHGRCAPDHQPDHFRVGAFLREVLVQQRLGQLLASLPGGG